MVIVSYTFTLSNLHKKSATKVHRFFMILNCQFWASLGHYWPLINKIGLNKCEVQFKEEVNNYLEIPNGMCAVSLLSHVPVHVAKSMDPALELHEIRRMGLYRQVNGWLGFVYHNRKSRQRIKGLNLVKYLCRLSIIFLTRLWIIICFWFFSSDS